MKSGKGCRGEDRRSLSRGKLREKGMEKSLLKGNPRGICIESFSYVCSGCIREADLESKPREYSGGGLNPCRGESVRYIGGPRGYGQMAYVCSRCGKEF